MLNSYSYTATAGIYTFETSYNDNYSIAKNLIIHHLLEIRGIYNLDSSTKHSMEYQVEKIQSKT